MKRRIGLFALYLVLLAGVAVAGTITKPHTFSPGGTIFSSQVNANFDTLYNDYNGNISTANILSIAEAKITFSATGHAHSGGTGGAPVQLVLGTNIAQAGTIAVPTDGNVFTVTGATGAITSMGTRNSGVMAFLQFQSAGVQLTHNGTSQILFGATNYTSVANDVLGFLSLGSGNWRQITGPRSPVTGQTTATTSGSTTSGTFVDMAAHSIALTTGGGKVLLTFSGTFENSGANNNWFTFVLDGANLGDATEGLQAFNQATAGARSAVGFSYLAEPTAGAHVYKVQWRTAAGTLSQDRGQFQAMEIK